MCRPSLSPRPHPPSRSTSPLYLTLPASLTLHSPPESQKGVWDVGISERCCNCTQRRTQAQTEPWRQALHQPARDGPSTVTSYQAPSAPRRRQPCLLQGASACCPRSLEPSLPTPPGSALPGTGASALRSQLSKGPTSVNPPRVTPTPPPRHRGVALFMAVTALALSGITHT